MSRRIEGCRAATARNCWPASRGARRLAVASLALLLSVCLVTPAAAQRQRSSKVLKQEYFLSFSSLYEGDYRAARSGFKQSLSRATKTTNTRWIDSICYYAMAGEVAYQLGNNAQALEFFNASLRLAIQYHDWMLFVKFGPLQPDASSRQPPPWGRSSRPFRLARYPETLNIERSRLGQTAIDGQKGVTKQSTYLPLHVDELVRCTALSIRRRTELMGPVCSRDKLTTAVLSRTSARPGPPNHWSTAWIDLLHGVSLIATGKINDARPLLKRSVVAAGEFDHPLTCVAFLELGKLAFHEGDYEGAEPLLAEASYSAYYFENPLVIEEALRYGFLIHLMKNKREPFPPLEAAIKWARAKRLHVLEASLAIMAAEHAATTGDARAVKNQVSRAIRAVGREDIAVSRLGAWFKYVEAIVASQQGDERKTQASLREALDFMRNGSVRLMQIALADHSYTQRKMSARDALELFGEVMQDPPAAMWRHEPLEALALLEYRNYDVLAHWFDLAIESGENRDDMSAAIEIADRTRRWRFYETLPNSGRALGLRWVLGAPEDALSETALLQRNDLIERYPKFRALQKQSGEFLLALKKLPLIPEESAELKQQQSLLDGLTRNGQTQDIEMRKVSLRREPIEMAFPRQLVFKSMLEKLGPRQAVLAFHASGRDMYAFLIMGKRHVHWKIASTRDVQKQLVALHRSLGNTGPAAQLDHDDIKNEKWRKTAVRLSKAIMKDSRVSLDQGIDELIVVPDGLLWYMPFELLQFGPDKNSKSLISFAQVRYAPTVSLAVADGRARRRGGATAIVPGKILTRDDEELTVEAAERLSKILPRAEILSDRPAAPSGMLAKTLDALVVLEAVESSEDPYNIAPWQIDRGRPGAGLDSWLSAPLGAPELVAWPGFRTPAEAGLKGIGRARPGDDLFLPICGMMSAGTRSLLISRWRAGGRTGQDILREYLQELPHTSAGDAWQRSVEIAMQSPLNAAQEPRMREDREDREVTATHPFFWSGYMVIDTTGPIQGSGAAQDGDEEGANEEDADDNAKGDGRPDIEFPGEGNDDDKRQ